MRRTIVTLLGLVPALASGATPTPEAGRKAQCRFLGASCASSST